MTIQPKEKLRKHVCGCYTCERNLKKLEKIGKLPKYNFVNESDSWINEIQLKEILKEMF